MKGQGNPMEKKEYRNAARSRQLIRHAFMDLLAEKTFEKITATDIIKRADINRSTFYAHYPDARGLLDEIVGDVAVIFQDLLSSMDFSEFFHDPRPILGVITEFMKENQSLYKMLIRSRMTLDVLDKLKQVLIQQVLSCPNLPVKDRYSAATEIRVRVILGGLVDAYRQWLSGEFTCTLDEATEEVAQIIQIWAAEFGEGKPTV